MNDKFLVSSRAGRASVRMAQGALALLLPSRVHRGPFRGLRFSKNTVGSALLPKLLGTYEIEIASRLHAAVTDHRVDAFIDIGCAGGFYLQLVSQLRPDITLVGVDADERAIRVARREVSNPARLELHGRYAQQEDIVDAAVRFRRPVVLIDIEGAEVDLVGDTIGERADNAVFVIEVHEYAGIDPTRIASAFRSTHDVEHIPFKYYGVESETALVPQTVRLFLRHELRHPATSYLVATPRG